MGTSSVLAAIVSGLVSAGAPPEPSHFETETETTETEAEPQPEAALEAEATPPQLWAEEGAGARHLQLGATLGSCRRERTEADAVGLCGELFLSGELHLPRRLRASAELGVGLMQSASSGDEVLGIAHFSGGPVYAALRLALGYDFTRFFFVRGGVQLRAAWALRHGIAGVQGHVDHGTRVWRRLELGFRVYYGVETVMSSDGRWGLGWGLGAMLLARVMVW